MTIPLAPSTDSAAHAAAALRAGREQFVAGALRESIALFRQAVVLRTAAFGTDDPRTIDAQRQLAAALAAAGLLDEAAERLQPVVAASARAVARARTRQASDLEAQARVLIRRRDWIAAEPVLRALLRECRVAHGSTGGPTLAALGQLATAWQQLGNPAAAERGWRRLLQIREAAGADPSVLAALRDRLAECAEAQARRVDALTLRLQASRVRAEGTGTAPVPIARARAAARPPTPAPRSPAPSAASPGALAPLAPDRRAPADQPPTAPNPTGWSARAAVAPYRRRLTLAAAVLLAAAGVWTMVSDREEPDPTAAAPTPVSLGAPSTEVYRP